jgi:putative ABC transport system permease protein
MVGDSYQNRRIVGTSPAMFGFDDDAKPANGYDASGHRLGGFQDPNIPEEERDANKPVAASTFEYRKGLKYELAEGTMFHYRRFEAVLGSDTAAKLHMHVYDPKLSEDENTKRGAVFRATHGFPGPNEKPDIHKPKWHVVGILKPTHTANDRVLFVPCVSLYAIEEHEIGLFYITLQKAGVDATMLSKANFRELVKKAGLNIDDPEQVPEGILKKFGVVPASATQPEPASSAGAGRGELMHETAPAPATAAASDDEEPNAYHLDNNGDIVPDVPQSQWEISAILVKTRADLKASQLLYAFKVGNTEAIAVNPAAVMRDFFDTFLKGSTQILLVISFLVTIVAAVAILVSIYNSVAAQTREIAILRALGATRVRVLTLTCIEAGLVGLAGGVIGFFVGHLTGAVESSYFDQVLGQGINWVRTGHDEWIYLVAVVALSVIAGLVPALKAYRTPVATNLVGL